MEKKNALWIGALLFIGIGVLGFLFARSVFGPGAVSEDGMPAEWAEKPAEHPDGPTVPKRVITAKHQYKNGKHIVAGEIELPTPCHTLDANATASADGAKVFLELRASVKSEEICAQVITPARFKIEVAGNKDAVWSATLDGEEVTLNLFEAGANEDLSKFELYIKG